MLFNTDNVDTDDDIWNLLDSLGSENSILLLNKKQNKDQCVNCQGTNLVQSKGCIECTDCGTCNSQTFDENPEWSMYEDGKGEGSMRCGAATNFFLPKSSLGTTISGKKYSILKMLQNWNQMPYKERSLSEILQYIEKVCRKNNLTKSVIDNAKILYKYIHDLKYDSEEKKNKSVIIRGNNRIGIYGACVHYGAQRQGYPRSIKEIANIFETTEKIITKGCRKFFELMKNNQLVNNVMTSSPNDFIERFCYKLKLKKEQISVILSIATNISRLNLASNHQPTSIAAGSILMYAFIYNIDIQKKLISEIFDISIVTIDKIYKKLLPFKKVIISDELTLFVKNKLMDAKYIMIDIDYQEELKINTDIFKQNMIELSESSSNYGDIATDLDTNDSDTVSLKSDDKNIGLVEKKKRGRKKKEIINIV